MILVKGVLESQFEIWGTLVCSGCSQASAFCHLAQMLASTGRGRAAVSFGKWCQSCAWAHHFLRGLPPGHLQEIFHRGSDLGRLGGWNTGRCGLMQRAALRKEPVCGFVVRPGRMSGTTKRSKRSPPLLRSCRWLTPLGCGKASMIVILVTCVCVCLSAVMSCHVTRTFCLSLYIVVYVYTNTCICTCLWVMHAHTHICAHVQTYIRI